MKFDLQLPEGCPSIATAGYEGTAYRLVQSDPPTSADLLTYLELNRLPHIDACRRGSVSLYATRKEAQHRLEVSPSLGPYIAAIEITADHGRFSQPGRGGHIDWWPYAGMRRCSELKVVSDEN